MSLTAWDHTGPGEIRPDALLSGLAHAAAIGMLVAYSQAWVFPLVGDGAGAEAAGGLIRACYFPAYMVGAVFLWRHWGRTRQALLRQPFLIVLMLIAALSTVWSIAPDQTTRRVFALYCTSLSGVVLGVRYGWTRLTEAVAAAFAIGAVASLIAAVVFPSIGVMSELFPGAWRGVWLEKNALGGNMAIGAVIMIAAAIFNPRRRRFWSAFALLAVFLVLMSTSKTALMSLLLGLGAIAFVAVARRGPAAGVASGWIAVLGVMLLASGLLFAADLFFAVLGKDATFTGRTKIWSATMRQIAEQPWTGYGYGVVWDEKGLWGPLARIIADAGFKPNHAHNAWIEQWLGLGVFGLGAFALFVLQTMVLGAAAAFRRRGEYLAAPYLVVYGLMTLTESVGAIYNDIRWVIFCAIATKLVLPDADAPSQSASLRAASATGVTSKPSASAASISRPRASGVHPQGDGSSRTSWV